MSAPNDNAQPAALKDEEDNEDKDSLADKSSQNSLMCRICHCEETSEEYLITPCYCSGTLRFVHQSCLQQWLKSNGKSDHSDLIDSKVYWDNNILQIRNQIVRVV